ncbi:hypothetical protein BCM14_0116 [Jezberella montanilacus]|uniref:Uncharacterized protein n=1 Tax=Jezberella montanilacus TaxID=323426 RepID=A0A2T0XQ96_9BURK|nr:hypothetical protein [Jezberella montanilacus]PRZ01096.1 hypothetical protein BCM14_0116 [Jezberella montanilacus]
MGEHYRLSAASDQIKQIVSDYFSGEAHYEAVDAISAQAAALAYNDGEQTFMKAVNNYLASIGRAEELSAEEFARRFVPNDSIFGFDEGKFKGKIFSVDYANDKFFVGTPDEYGDHCWLELIKDIPALVDDMLESPEPEDVAAARAVSGLTQTEAARVIHSTLRAWQNWEGGHRSMHPGLFELFKIKTGQLDIDAG